MSQEYHFKWAPISSLVRFDSKGVVNHFEGHIELSTKERLLKNLHVYCELNKLNVFDIVPVSFVISIREPGINAQLERFQQYFELLSVGSGEECCNLTDLNNRLTVFPYPS